MSMSLVSDLHTRQSVLKDLLRMLQLVGAFSRSYLPTAIDKKSVKNNPRSKPETGKAALEPGAEQTYLRWWSPGQLVGRAIGTRRALRTAVSLPEFELLLLEQSSRRITHIRARLPLDGKTPAEVAEWLESKLAEALPRGYSRPIKLPHTLEHESSEPIKLQSQALQQLTSWYDQAHQLLSELAEYLDLRCTPIRCAVQNGELSFGITLPQCHLEAGFSVGDLRCADPYFFVKAWPVLPESALEQGYWPSYEVQHVIMPLQGLSHGQPLPEEAALKFLQNTLVNFS